MGFAVLILGGGRSAENAASEQSQGPGLGGRKDETVRVFLMAAYNSPLLRVAGLYVQHLSIAHAKVHRPHPPRIHSSKTISKSHLGCPIDHIESRCHHFKEGQKGVIPSKSQRPVNNNKG